MQRQPVQAGQYGCVTRVGWKQVGPGTFSKSSSSLLVSAAPTLVCCDAELSRQLLLACAEMHLAEPFCGCCNAPCTNPFAPPSVRSGKLSAAPQRSSSAQLLTSPLLQEHVTGMRLLAAPKWKRAAVEREAAAGHRHAPVCCSDMGRALWLRGTWQGVETAI